MTFDPWEDAPLTLERNEPPPPPRPKLGRSAVIGGVAAACVLGLGLGLAAKPELIGRGPEPAPMQPRPATAVGQIDVVMAEPPPAPPIPERPPLETMSPELIAAAPKPPPPPEPEPQPQPEPSPPPSALDSAVDADVRAPDPIRTTRPSFDCRRARSLAEDMVCSEPVLAAADRQLARAYQRALRLGVPYGLLRDEQDAWLEAREDAAHRSPRALAAIYDQRIEELNAMADAAGRPW